MCKFVMSCVCMAHDVCIMLGLSLVFLAFCYILIRRKDHHILLFYHNIGQAVIQIASHLGLKTINFVRARYAIAPPPEFTFVFLIFYLI